MRIITPGSGVNCDEGAKGCVPISRKERIREFTLHTRNFGLNFRVSVCLNGSLCDHAVEFFPKPHLEPELETETVCSQTVHYKVFLGSPDLIKIGLRVGNDANVDLEDCFANTEPDTRSAIGSGNENSAIPIPLELYGFTFEGSHSHLMPVPSF